MKFPWLPKQPAIPPVPVKVGQEWFCELGFTYERVRITDILTTPRDVVVRFEYFSTVLNRFIGNWSLPLEDFRKTAVRDDPTIHLTEVK